MPQAPQPEEHELQRVTKYAFYFRTKKDLDTVVFVHGLNGNYLNSWGKFPELLKNDPDLPDLDILLAGYETSAMRFFVEDTESIGRQLTTTLTTQIPPDNSIHLVGHSMGGLVILQGLVQEMVAERAQRHPAVSVSYISLYASPVSGSRKAQIAKDTLGRLWGLKIIVNAQICALASGPECEEFIEKVHKHLYKPQIENSSARKIPIRMLMASFDKAVDFHDTETPSALYSEVPAQQLANNHTDIKLPESCLENRYRVLANDIQQGFAERFQQICKDCRSDNKNIKENAKIEFFKRYETILRRRFEDAQLLDYHQFLRVVIKHSASYGHPPSIAANRAVIEIRNEEFKP